MAHIQRYTYTYDKFKGSFEAETQSKIDRSSFFFKFHSYIILANHTPVAFARALTYSPDDLIFLMSEVKIRKARS